jgi:hypothetical protein
MISLPSLFAGGASTVGGLILRLVLLAAFYFAWRSYGNFREELADANRAGRMLAWITIFITGFAAYLSAWLLVS